MKRVGLRITYVNDRPSLGDVLRSLEALNQFYCLSFLSEQKVEIVQQWLLGRLDWLGPNNLTLRVLRYGSPCDTEVAITDENETAIRSAADQMTEAIRYLERKRRESQLQQIVDDIGNQLLPTSRTLIANHPVARFPLAIIVSWLAVVERVEIISVGEEPIG